MRKHGIVDVYSGLSRLMAYPGQAFTDIQSRLEEAQSLGIQRIFAGGNETLRGVSILGKGYCGVVMLAHWSGQGMDRKMVALKARRTDAPKSSLDTEAKGLAIANSLNIGPKLYAHSSNFMVMDYLDGPTIEEWLQAGTAEDSINLVLQDLLEQCFRLDQAGLDHGNLRCITEHVILQDNRPVLIDFSSSSRDRRPANVTTLTQGLFWGTRLPSWVEQYRSIPPKEEIVPLLRQYKQSPSAVTFQQLLSRLLKS